MNTNRFVHEHHPYNSTEGSIHLDWNKKLYAILMTLVMLIGVLGLSIGFSSLTGSILLGNTGTISVGYAKSGSAADVQTAVNAVAVAGGGTVTIPAGTWNWTVTSTTKIGANIPCAVIIPAGVSVIGTDLAGCDGHPSFNVYASQTKIVLLNAFVGNVTPVTLFGVNGLDAVGKPVRISGIEFIAPSPANSAQEQQWGDGIGGPSSGNAIYIFQAINYRIDHCTFTNWADNAVGTDTLSGYSLGVIDHCYTQCPYKLSGTGWVWGVGFYGRGYYAPLDGFDSWISNPAEFFGQFTAIAGYPIMYVEDCSFKYMRHCIDGCMGAYYCARFNLFNDSLDNYQCGMADLHGTPDSVGGGGRGNEVYNCIFVEPATGGWWNTQDWAYQLRDGSGLFYNNNFTSTGNGHMVYLSLQDDQGNADPAQHVNQTYLWNNEYNGILQTSSSSLYLQVDSPLAQDVNYFLRAPNQAQDGFTYTPYPYPFPLTIG